MESSLIGRDLYLARQNNLTGRVVITYHRVVADGAKNFLLFQVAEEQKKHDDCSKHNKPLDFDFVTMSTKEAYNEFARTGGGR